MASFASLGDLILAEPGALIGFAGPRVIKDTTQQVLPEGFQTAEFLLQHGLLDQIVTRTEMKSRIATFLSAFHRKGPK
jgi:acetyl-CoA carboxylase carboxyl transferase subunit beta